MPFKNTLLSIWERPITQIAFLIAILWILYKIVISLIPDAPKPTYQNLSLKTPPVNILTGGETKVVGPIHLSINGFGIQLANVKPNSPKTRDILETIMNGKHAWCNVIAINNDGFGLGVCTTSLSLDIGAELVHTGYAIALSNDYTLIEKSARQLKIGAWSQ